MEKKEMIYQYIHNETIKKIQNDDFQNLGFDSLDIAQKLKMDRANASRLLNQLFNEGRLIKQLDRPVLFFERESLENYDTNIFIPSVLQKNQKITDFFRPVIKKENNIVNSFSRYIINTPQSKMSIPVEQAKSAILYPEGLNILIIGEQGSGRLQFARSIYNFAKEREIIDSDQKINIIECLNYADQNPESFLRFIFGENIQSSGKAKKGALHQSKKNIVIFNNINQLPEKSSTALFNAILDHSFSPINSNKTIELTATIIATSSEKSMLNNSDIHRCFPMVIDLPNLSERSIMEKLVIILQYFQDECIKINQGIRISKDVLSCFVMSEYKGNLAHLRSEVRQSCAIAYHQHLKHNSFYLNINFDDISTQVLTDIHNIDDRIEELHETLNLFQNDFLFFTPHQINPELALLYEINDNSETDKSIYINEAQEDLINQCINDINHASITKLNTTRSISVKQIYDSIYPIVKEHPLCKNEHLLYGLLVHISNVIIKFKEGSPQSLFTPLNRQIAKKEDYKLADAINKLIKREYKLTLENSEIDYIATYLYLSSQWINQEYIQMVLCFKNKRIADNYKVYLNGRNTKTYVESFYIDSTLDPNILEQKLIEKFKTVDRGKGVIIATDIKPIITLLEKENKIPKIYKLVKDISLQNLILVSSRIEALGVSIYNIQFKEEKNTITHNTTNNIETQPMSLLKEIETKLLSESLTFLNPTKACQTLYMVLLNIINDLSIPYSDDLLIKFLFHTSFTIERCIKKEPYNYPKSKSLIKMYPSLYETIDKNIQLIYEVFSVQFPLSEIGYIIEIFLPYLS